MIPNLDNGTGNGILLHRAAVLGVLYGDILTVRFQLVNVCVTVNTSFEYVVMVRISGRINFFEVRDGLLPVVCLADSDAGRIRLYAADMVNYLTPLRTDGLLYTDGDIIMYIVAPCSENQYWLIRIFAVILILIK